MTNLANQRIIEKIKRCLALSKSSNETESATALRQAHKMMKQYGISQDDVRLKDIIFNPSDSTLPNRPPVHIIHLAHMIKNLFGCLVYLDRNNTNNKKQLVFVGLDLHVTIASYAFDALVRQLKQARKNYISNELKRVKIRANKIKRADYFCMGWVRSVENLVKDIVPPATDLKLIEQAIESKMELTTAKAIDRVSGKCSRRAESDYLKGVVAGRNAKLHHAMPSDYVDTQRLN